jgi:hypothetical protein
MLMSGFRANLPAHGGEVGTRPEMLEVPCVLQEEALSLGVSEAVLPLSDVKCDAKLGAGERVSPSVREDD